MTLASDSVAGGPWNQVSGSYDTKCKFPGDFDAHVDFALLDWPFESGVFAGLNAIFANTAVGRRSSTQFGDTYASWVIPANNEARLRDASGSLRIRRVNGVMTTYFRHLGKWTKLVSGRDNGSAVLSLQAFATDADFEHLGIRVAFDNFVVTTRRLVCPPGANPS